MIEFGVAYSAGNCEYCCALTDGSISSVRSAVRIIGSAMEMPAAPARRDLISRQHSTPATAMEMAATMTTTISAISACVILLDESSDATPPVLELTPGFGVLVDDNGGALLGEFDGTLLLDELGFHGGCVGANDEEREPDDEEPSARPVDDWATWPHVGE